MRRTPRLLGVLLALLMLMVVVGLVLFGMVLLSKPVPGVTESNFYRVQIGMSENEVEAQLGGPAMSVEKEGRSSWKCWLGEKETCVRILVGPDGVVLNGYFVRNGRQEGNLVERGLIDRNRSLPFSPRLTVTA